MNEKMKNKSVYIIRFLVVLACLTLFVITVLWQLIYGKQSYMHGKSMLLSEGWIAARDNGKREEIQSGHYLNTPKGEPIILTNVLPMAIHENMSLLVLTARSTDIYIDGKLRGNFNNLDNPLTGDTLSSVYFEVQLTPDDAGKKIMLYRNDPKQSNGSLPAVYIGDSMGIFWSLFEQYGAKFVLSVIFFAFSFALLFVGVFISIRNKKLNNTTVLSFGFMNVALWEIFDNQIYYYFSRVNYIPGMLAFLYAMVIPFPFLYYINRIQERRYQIAYNILEAILVLNHAVLLVLHFTETISLIDTLVELQGCIIAAVILLFITILLDYKKKYVGKYRMVYFGLLGVAFFGFLEIVQMNLPGKRMIKLDGFFLLLGMFFMMIMCLFQAIYQMSEMEKTTARAERENELKSSFLANMSHEIRTPVNAIMGMNELILREASNADVKKYAVDVKEASENLLEIINDILDFSKIEAGRMELNDISYDFSVLLHDVNSIIGVKTDDKGLSYEMEVDPTIPIGLYGDGQKLRQVLINLLNNAVKYTERGSISFKILKKNEDFEENVELEFRIKDTGRGIKAEDFEKLFTEFSRADEKANSMIEGTGLGLAITKRYVEMMGGKIFVMSEFGAGSEFIVTLSQKIDNYKPIGDFKKQAKERLMDSINYKPAFEAPGIKLLVVDDNEVNLKVVKGLLKKTKVEVELVSSGAEMLKLVEVKKYDMIFLDHMMPGMNGIEALEKMRQMPSCINENTPVVALTANALKGVEEVYKQAGFDGYLAKPIRSEQLENTIKQMLHL